MMDHEAAEGHEGKCLRACVMKKFQIVSAAPVIQR